MDFHSKLEIYIFICTSHSQGIYEVMPLWNI